jgi:hypothetical protein
MNGECEMAETCLASVRRLKEAVVLKFSVQCRRMGLACSWEMRDAVVQAVEEALTDILMERRNDPPEGEAVATVDVAKAQWKACQEGRMPGIQIKKTECLGKIADFIVVDDPVRGPVKGEEFRDYMDAHPEATEYICRRVGQKAIEHMDRQVADFIVVDDPAVPRDREMDIVRDRIGRAMIDHLGRQLAADVPCQATPPDGNPYSDLPLSANPCRDISSPELDPFREYQRQTLDALSASLRKPVNPPEVGQAAMGVPAVHGPGLGVHGREAVVESIRQQYGDRAAQAEAERLGAVAEPGLAEVERAICATLAEIGYPAGDPGRPLRLMAAARLAEEVAKAADISSDGCPAIGRPQALHNLNWLLRNKFPPGKIDARKIARLSVSDSTGHQR